jgi:MraZ protein
VRGTGVEIEHFFSGSALNAVDAKGRLSVPANVRSIIERRSEARAIMIGPHEADPCLVAYDRNYGRYLFLENERLRLKEEADARTASSRNRRTFATAEEVPYDPSGRIILPRLVRTKGRIEELALFVGAGATVEIWNPKLALESGDDRLRELAAYHLEEKGIAL